MLGVHSFLSTRIRAAWGLNTLLLEVFAHYLTNKPRCLVKTLRSAIDASPFGVIWLFASPTLALQRNPKYLSISSLCIMIAFCSSIDACWRSLSTSLRYSSSLSNLSITISFNALLLSALGIGTCRLCVVNSYSYFVSQKNSAGNRM